MLLLVTGLGNQALLPDDGVRESALRCRRAQEIKSAPRLRKAAPGLPRPLLADRLVHLALVLRFLQGRFGDRILLVEQRELRRHSVTARLGTIALRLDLEAFAANLRRKDIRRSAAQVRECGLTECHGLSLVVDPAATVTEHRLCRGTGCTDRQLIGRGSDTVADGGTTASYPGVTRRQPRNSERPNHEWLANWGCAV